MTLKEQLKEYHLLSHPFYQAWMEGKLTISDLKQYAQDYMPHVEAFPRFVSSLHSLCPHESDRKEIMRNLMDEEGVETNLSHPQLWKDFGLAVGATGTSKEDHAIRLVETFTELSRASYPASLGALYAYEYQVPEIAKTKIEGLKKYYGISESKALAFFEVHLAADVYHSQSCEDMLEKLSPAEKEVAKDAAIKASKALWDFLSGVDNARKSAH